MKFSARKALMKGFKSSFVNFSLTKNALFIPGFMPVKVYMLFITGIYYNSQVTCFVNNMSARLPDSINAKILASRNFMKLDSESKWKVCKNYYLSDTSKNTSNVSDGTGIHGKESEVTKLDLITDKVQALTFSEYETSTVDALDVTINDIRGFKNEIVEDVVAGFLGGFEKAGQKYLDLTFREKNVHKASIDLLNYAIKEESFVKKSRTYGIELINDVVMDQQFQKASKVLSLAVVRHDDVKKASVDLLIHCVNHNTTQTFVKTLMKQVMIQSNTHEVLKSSLCDAVLQAVYMPETNGHLGTLFHTVAAMEVVQTEMKNSLLYENVSNRVPFIGKSSNANFKLSETKELQIANWVTEKQTL
jgi:hypothetical protein